MFHVPLCSDSGMAPCGNPIPVPRPPHPPLHRIRYIAFSAPRAHPPRSRLTRTPMLMHTYFEFGRPLATRHQACSDCVVPPRGRLLVPTGIAIALPPETYGRIASRSGLALKNGIDVGAGVIDGDYRGEIKVLLFNHSDEPFPIAAGSRIAQLICERCLICPVQEHCAWGLGIRQHGFRRAFLSKPPT
ncbi:putative deoxyuridine 5'-triphosphate nucleotidohydrolase [Paratrimastix pyriformis]|uniref:Deoxyuridine 5'-triphosphate nucleotidohydrolase n=1 Tax=Paratrimastix pyriformis TaxID=342808 RepID=A0ABQ8UXA5_9EUKA|nr:putative deoxyuridine 5'-triphosphate nucleotidohydrolase [Paratrimastix pyriformis]